MSIKGWLQKCLVRQRWTKKKNVLWLPVSLRMNVHKYLFEVRPVPPPLTSPATPPSVSAPTTLAPLMLLELCTHLFHLPQVSHRYSWTHIRPLPSSSNFCANIIFSLRAFPDHRFKTMSPILQKNWVQEFFSCLVHGYSCRTLDDMCASQMRHLKFWVEWMSK